MRINRAVGITLAALLCPTLAAADQQSATNKSVTSAKMPGSLDGTPTPGELQFDSGLLRTNNLQLSPGVQLSFMLDESGNDQAVLRSTSGQWQIVDSLKLRAGVDFANTQAVDCSNPLNQRCFGATSDDRSIESYSLGASWRPIDSVSLDVNVYSQPLLNSLGRANLAQRFVELDLNQTEGVDVGVSCDFDMGKLGEIALGVQVSHIDQTDPLLEADPLASASLGVGWRRGTISGDLTSRYVGSLTEDYDVEDGWTTFDLSFGWRTPWNARLSLGAKNLLDTAPPENQLLNTPDARLSDDLFGRVPYVRYQQDL